MRLYFQFIEGLARQELVMQVSTEIIFNTFPV